jgi:predicted ArsR family transcriptional regulator
LGAVGPAVSYGCRRFAGSTEIEDLSEAVKDLVRRYIRSVYELEALLMVSARPEREWRAAELSQALYIAPAAAREQLARLQAYGLLRQVEGPDTEPAYRYDPDDPKLVATVAELAVEYAQRRVRVIELIYSRPSDSVRSFAHAFKFKRDSDR